MCWDYPYVLLFYILLNVRLSSPFLFHFCETWNDVLLTRGLLALRAGQNCGTNYQVRACCVSKKTDIYCWGVIWGMPGACCCCSQSYYRLDTNSSQSRQVKTITKDSVKLVSTNFGCSSSIICIKFSIDLIIFIFFFLFVQQHHFRKIKCNLFSLLWRLYQAIFTLQYPISWAS